MSDNHIVSIGDHDIVFSPDASLALLFALAEIHFYQLIKLEKPPEDVTIN